MGCGKGGDITKWTKAKIREILGVGAYSSFSLSNNPSSLFSLTDIAAVSVDQARDRWLSQKGPKFEATFAALDCYKRVNIESVPTCKTRSAIRCRIHAILYALCIRINTKSPMHARQCHSISTPRWRLHRHNTNSEFLLCVLFFLCPPNSLIAGPYFARSGNNSTIYLRPPKPLIR